MLNETEAQSQRRTTAFHEFLTPGLDRRFGWSEIPVGTVRASDALVFLVFRENPFASRVVEVEPGQRVISTGPYSLVRHPMYLGTSIMWLAAPSRPAHTGRCPYSSFCP